MQNKIYIKSTLVENVELYVSQIISENNTAV